MIQQSVLNKARYNALSTLTSTLVFNLFVDCIDDLVLEDDNVIVGTSLILRNPTSRNGVGLGKELEPTNCSESPQGIEGQVTNQPKSDVYY